MDKPIIEIRNISKKYKISYMKGGYIALRDVLANILKNPFSFIRTKAKQAVGLEKKEEFWALKNISFNVNKGEVVGIIGANGAGKSTLLKILSQITPPTEGEMVLRGRVGSLLEVGTGFHPELTGRENIFLNGAILGMKKKEIAKKFDEIVAFAGIEKFLDTPVKYYSSGMYVRLAFSVAAHMDPDILIIDEVLAVGDAEFQKKCLGKMEDITKNEGRTILFVSHNLSAIENLCEKTLVLVRGESAMFGETRKSLDYYQSILNEPVKNSTSTEFSFLNGSIILKNFIINSSSINKKIEIKSGEPINISCEVLNIGNKNLLNLGYGIRRKKDNLLVAFTHAELEGVKLSIDKNYDISTEIKVPFLSPDNYIIELYVWINGVQITKEKTICDLTIPGTTILSGGNFFNSFPAVVFTNSVWKIK